MNQNETLDFTIEAIEGLLKHGGWEDESADFDLVNMCPVFPLIKAKVILQALKEFRGDKNA